MAENDFDTEEKRQTESVTEEEVLVARNNEGMLQLLQAAFQASDARQTTDEPDALMTVLGVYNEKPVEQWQESEYAKVLGSVQGVRGTDEENQLADNIRDYILKTVDDKHLNKDTVIQESTAGQSTTPREFKDVSRDMIDSLMHMSVAQRSAKKREFMQTAQKLGGQTEHEITAALTLLDDVEQLYTNRQVANQELQFANPSSYPITGDAAFDRAFPNILRAVQNAHTLDEYNDIFNASKDMIIQKGAPQHRALLDQLRHNIDSFSQDQLHKQYYGERERRMHKEKDMPYSPEDKPLYTGTIDQTLEVRMNRILGADTQNPISDDQKREYYRYLQRWVGKVLRNDKLLNSRDGTLMLSAERREKFLEIRDNKITDVDKIMENVRYLQDPNEGRLTRYFMRGKDKDSEALIGNDRIQFTQATADKSLIGAGIRDDEGELEGRMKNQYLPETLDEIVELIEEQYGQNWDIKPGDAHELIDVDGNFHLENFVTFVRAQANYLEGENPKGEIDPLSQISLKLSMGSVSMTEIVYSDQFRRQKRFKISGSDDNEESIFGQWGEKEEHPDFKRYQAEVLLYETGYFAKGHNSTATWLEKAGSANGFKEEVNKFNIDGFIARGNWTVFAQAGSRRDGDDHEFKVGSKGAESDGTVGRSMREMMVAYSHLTDFTEFHTYQKGDPLIGKTRSDGKIIKVGDAKLFEHNTFYRFLEANGTNAFLHGVAEAALDSYPEAKGVYNEFIKERITATKNNYLANNPNLSENAKQELLQLEKQYFEGMKLGNRDYRHRLEFNRNDLLERFHKKAREITGYKGDNKGLADEIREDMLTHLNDDFFKKVSEIEVYGVDTDSSGGRIPSQRLSGEKKNKLGNKKFGDKKFSDILQAFAEQNSVENYKKFIDYDYEKETGPDTKSAAFTKYLAANEQMALAMGESLHNFKRIDLNYFRNTDHDPSKEYLVDIGIRKAIAEKAFKLEDIEAEYSWRYAKNYLKPLGISGQLDTVGVGYDFWTRLTRPEAYLKRQLGRGYPVIHHLLHEYHMFGMNMLDMVEVKKPGEKIKEHSMMSIFEGRNGYDITERKNRKIDSGEIIIEPGAQRNVLQNHIDNSINFLDALKKGDFDFAKMFHHDFRGYPIFQKEVATKLIGDLWKMIRYSTDQTGIDYSRIINKDGIEQDILHHAFGAKTRTLLEVMQKEQYKDNPKRPYTNPGIGLMGTLIGAVIEEHRNDPGEHRWNVEQIKQVEFVVGRATKDKFVQFTPKVFDTMLKMYNTDYKRMYTIESLWSLFSVLGIVVGSGLSKMVEEIPQHK